MPADELDVALRQARNIVEAVGYTDGLTRQFELPELPAVDPNTAAALHARVEWYRSALRETGE